MHSIPSANHPNAGSVPPHLMVGKLLLDTRRRVAHIGSRHIHLTGTEVSLLEFLMRHAGTAVSRQDIFHSVWKSTDHFSSNVVDVHVKNLRKKIKSKSSPEVATIRGMGYKMIK